MVESLRALPVQLPSERVEPAVTIDKIEAKETTSRFSFPDGMKVYSKIWPSAVTPARARVLFIHGFADHCNTYDVLFGALASYGITVVGYDKRGWGRTALNASVKEEEKGQIGTTAVVLDDMNAVLTEVLENGSVGDGADVDVPLFLVGHSMGGGEVLTFACCGDKSTRERVRGYGVESPFIGFPAGQSPSKIVELGGRLAAKLVPKWQMVRKPVVENVSRDRVVQEEFRNDPLCWGTCSFEGLASLLDRTADLGSAKTMLSETDKTNDGISLWIGHGTDDKVTDYDSAKRWFEAAQVNDKRWKSYPGWYHKLHAEPGNDKLEFARDLAEWILTRASVPRDAKL